MNRRTTTAALGALITMGVGCDFKSPAKVEVVKDDAATTASPAAPCVPGVSEKIGVKFVRVCPTEEGAHPFWISAIPMGCSAGAHETVPCPPVTAVVQPTKGLPESLGPATPKLAAVVEVYTAHKICTMRFAGRLPTRNERARARAMLGAASVIVTESPETHTFRPRELAEWVTEKVCDQPTDLAPDCNPGPFPSTSISAVRWDMLARCEARPVTRVSASLPFVELGGECTGVRGADTASLRLPCALRGPAHLASGSAVTGFELWCSPPEPTFAHPEKVLPDLAAFRCVLPELV
jgi:hypothetical protein